jgi:hypothetical protein
MLYGERVVTERKIYEIQSTGQSPRTCMGAPVERYIIHIFNSKTYILY